MSMTSFLVSHDSARVLARRLHAQTITDETEATAYDDLSYDERTVLEDEARGHLESVIPLVYSRFVDVLSTAMNRVLDEESPAVEDEPTSESPEAAETDGQVGETPVPAPRDSLADRFAALKNSAEKSDVTDKVDSIVHQAFPDEADIEDQSTED